MDWYPYSVTQADNGFPSERDLDGHMPGSNGDWTQPIDYANGRMYNRLEIRQMPTRQTFSWQTCFHQNGISLESCGTQSGSINGPAGGAPAIETWNFNVNAMSAHADGPVSWSSPRSMIFGVIRGPGGYISPYEWLNPSTGAWGGNDPTDWYPMLIRWTIVVVSNGSSFSGWNRYISGITYSNATCTPPSVPDSVSTNVVLSINAAVASGSITNMTIDLRPLSGAASQAMTNSSGNTWSVSYQVPAGLNRGTISPIVTATNSYGAKEITTIPTKITGYSTNWLENFNDGNADGWVAAGNEWNVNEGRYTNKWLHNISGMGATYAGESDWTDITYSVDVTPISATDVRVLFRVQDTSNYCFFSLQSGAIFKVVGGRSFFVGAGSGASFDTANTYRIKTVLEDSSIKIYSGNTLIVDATDDEFSSGCIGFAGTRNASGFFDNVEVINNTSSTQIKRGVLRFKEGSGLNLLSSAFKSATKITLIGHPELENDDFNLRIRSIHGKLLKVIKTDSHILKNGIVWDTSKQTPGVYILSLESGTINFAQKLLLMK